MMPSLRKAVGEVKPRVEHTALPRSAVAVGESTRLSSKSEFGCATCLMGLSVPRLRGPSARLHGDAQSPGPGSTMFIASSPTTRLAPAARRSIRYCSPGTNASALRRSAKGGVLPGLARLLSALTPSSFLLGLVSAAAAAATALGASRALAAPAGGSRRVRDRRRPRLIHSFLPQSFVLLVVLDTWSMIFCHGVLL